MDTLQYPKRKHPRLDLYDYSSEGYYFVTICTHQKRCIFGNPKHLNALGRIAQEGLTSIDEHFPDVIVDKYVVMPNHIHAIIVLRGNSVNLSTVIGSYKSYVTQKIHSLYPKLEVWQTSFHDHIIRNQHGYEQIWSYIDSNPDNWEADCFFLQ